MRPQLLRACDLVTKKEAERRVLCLENPTLRGTTFVCDSLFAGLQIIMPGEIAPSHRHTPSALRFIVEGEGAYTAVAGEKLPMKPGDFVVTPAWAWHDHGNLGTTPVVWLDGLDTPFARFFGAAFREEHADDKQPIDRPDGESISSVRHEPAFRTSISRTGMSTPVLIYPYERTRAALDSMAEPNKPHPAHGFRLRYANPATGKHPFPTMAVSMQRLPTGFTGKTYRSTGSAVFAVHAAPARREDRRRDLCDRAARRVRRAAVAALQLHGRQRDRAVQLFRPRRAGGAGLLARADRMISRALAAAAFGARSAARRRCTRSRPLKR